MAKWPESQNKEFNAYLEMGIAQGWADPVGFAERRMAELQRGGPTKEQPDRPTCKPDGSCCDFICGN